MRDPLLVLIDAAITLLSDGGDSHANEVSNRERLCFAVNLIMRNTAQHDWGLWREPYAAAGGVMWQSRTCRLCGEREFRQAQDAPCVAGCDPGDCQCSTGKEK